MINDVGTVGSTMQFFGSLPLCLLSTIKVLKCTKLIPHQFILFCELTCSYTILYTLLVCMYVFRSSLGATAFPANREIIMSFSCVSSCPIGNWELAPIFPPRGSFVVDQLSPHSFCSETIKKGEK